MNILNIMIKEIKQMFRDKQSMIIMIGFPILLIVILGSAFSGQFSSDKKFTDINVIYKDNGGNISEGFKKFMETSKDMGINFIELKNNNEGIEKIEDTDYTCYLVIKENEISLYRNERYNFNANIVEGTLSTFMDRYNIIVQIAKVNPEALSKIDPNKAPDFVKFVSLEKKKQPRSFDYFSITMTTLIIMYGSFTGLWGINSERIGKTGNRIASSPVKRHEVLIGKLTGGILGTSLQVLTVLFVSKYILGADWGNHQGIVLLILLSQTIMVVALGAGIAHIIKSETAASGFVNVFVPFLVFFGGGYVPLEQFNNKLILTISKLSPVKWTNDSLFQVIYTDSMSKVPYAIGINLIIAISFIIFVSSLFGKELDV